MTIKHNPPPSDAAGDKRSAGALAVLRRFLAGENIAAGRVADAVRQLARTDPEALALIRQAVLAQLFGAGPPAAGDCAPFQESLERYAELGKAAAKQMPEVHAHLQACPHCKEALGIHRRVQRQEPAWKALAKRLDVPQTLVIRRKGWFIGAGRVWAPQTDSDLARRRRVGDWSLWPTEPSQAEIFGPAQPKTLARTLAYDLPGNAGTVLVSLAPEFQGVENREVWRLGVQLAPHSRTPVVNVSLGTKDRARTGRRQVSADAPADFPPLEPATRSSLWIYFRWQNPDGAWQEAKTEFPVRSKPGGPDS